MAVKSSDRVILLLCVELRICELRCFSGAISKGGMNQIGKRLSPPQD